MADALAEDPTIYEYDNIYDMIQEQKKKSDPKNKTKKDTKVKTVHIPNDLEIRL